MKTATEAALAVLGAFLILAPGIYTVMRIQQWREQRPLPPGGNTDKLPPGGDSEI